MPDLERIRRDAQRRVWSFLPSMIARVDWPRERLEAYREARLRSVLADLMLGSRWHRERLTGIDPRTFSLDELASLPTMSKSDLMSNFDAISTDPRITLSRCAEHLERGELLIDGELGVIASGGTSGVRALAVPKVAWMAEAWAGGIVRFVMRWALRTGAFPTPPRVALSEGLAGDAVRTLMSIARRAGAAPEGPSMAILGPAPGPHGGRFLGTIFGGPGGARLSVVDPIDEIVAALNEADPDHLIVYSSFIPRLAEEARRGRLRIRPGLVTPVAEPFLDEHAGAVADVWGCATLGSWGATEVGMIAAGSGFESGMLLADDLTMVEPVDASGRPVGPGERADKVFVTPLIPKVVPVLRYELTDEVTVLAEPAVCGSSFTRVSNVLGRLDEAFVYDGVHVHPHVFRTVLGRRRSIVEYQVEQTPRGAVVRVVPGGGDALDAAAVVRELEGSLGRLGVREPGVGLEVVTEIPRDDRSSKLRRFVPLRSMGAEPVTGVDTDAA